MKKIFYLTQNENERLLCVKLGDHELKINVSEEDYKALKEKKVYEIKRNDNRANA